LFPSATLRERYFTTQETVSYPPLIERRRNERLNAPFDSISRWLSVAEALGLFPSATLRERYFTAQGAACLPINYPAFIERSRNEK